MKKITIVCLLATASFISACHKIDLPHKKRCQISSIEDIYHPSPITTTDRITRYAYNKQRLLDSLTVQTSTGTQPPLNVRVTYNNQGKPVGLTGPAGTYKLIYQNGHVSRVDQLDNNGQYQPLYTFVYDTQGRITERQAATSALRLEYEGTSKNFKRRLDLQITRPGGPLELFMAYEYSYDDKANPMLTWPNTSLLPFYFDIVAGTGRQFEPIPENNWTRQNVTSSFRGAQLQFREYLYTYQYDDVYPVKYDLLLLTSNPFISRVDTTRGVTRFFYNCEGRNNHSKF
ncbi:hypothetical protein [Pseudoflavitalea rhizosphaerae]|uniref:hypothetical protein n=1 Tax=Pseudoflavitalea rhizosphaerae TaxID=1884793 RepID=UPI000F8EC238|nr:hypothetical protein [Pseudoflavitalea rhizosphaerae]